MLMKRLMVAGIGLCVVGLLVWAPQAYPQAAEKPAPKGIVGTWQGTLKVGAIELRLVFHIAKDKEGALTGTMDSIDQGVKGIPLSEVSAKDGKVKFGVKTIAGTFEGEMNKDEKEIAGKWKQGPGEWPLTVKHVAKAAELRRPQEPKKPYPYVVEEVTYENRSAGIKLAGTLTLPRGSGPFPAVLLITGSGPQDRDETIFGHKPFLVLADYLTRRGIAALRVDDRGVGGSTGKTMESTTADFVGDVLTGVEYLKGRREINAKQIGLIGHSEGAIIAPLAASRSPDVAFIVMLAGTGLRGDEVLYSQGQAILKAMGAKPDQLAEQRTLQGRLLKVALEEKDPAAAKKKLDAIVAEVKAQIKDQIKDKAKDKDKEAGAALAGALDGQVQMVLTPWFRYFLSYDPRPSLQQVHCPVLVLNGEKDVQVVPKDNLPEIGKALKEGGNKDHTIKELPGLNHLFQTCKTGSLTEYGQIEETIAPLALTTIGDWILQHTERRPSAAR
jgi:pimeloyl-ACP methyl ester carboxylesterase